MAGDWLQIDLDLPEKWEVQAITDASRLCHADVTLGRLILFWRWVERHASSELVRGARIQTLVRVVGGDEDFWRAVESVGWVSFTEEGVVIPGWKKRFSKSAKSRILAARRQKRRRANVTPKRDKSHASALPKEEKRREEYIDTECAARASLFEQFWEAYPKRNGRRLGKSKARALFKNLGIQDQALAVAAALNYAESSDAKRGFAKDPERFLKSDYWRDWLEQAQAPPVASRAPTDEDLANWNPVDGGLGALQ